MDKGMMQLRPGDELVVQTFLLFPNVCKVKLFRDGKEVKRLDGGNGFTQYIDTQRAISAMMRMIAKFCNSSVVEVESDKKGIFKYHFEAIENNKDS